MFVRARYGHGGRWAWKRNGAATPPSPAAAKCSTRAFISSTSSRWFLGDFAQVEGHVERFFWDWQVEDNGFALPAHRRRAGRLAARELHRMEKPLQLRDLREVGKLHIEGLGGSYGVERLTYYQMLPEMGPPQDDELGISLAKISPGDPEFEHLHRMHSRPRNSPSAPSHDALAAHAELWQQLYRDAPAARPEVGLRAAISA